MKTLAIAAALAVTGCLPQSGLRKPSSLPTTNTSGTDSFSSSTPSSTPVLLKPLSRTSFEARQDIQFEIQLERNSTSQVFDVIATGRPDWAAFNSNLLRLAGVPHFLTSMFPQLAFTASSSALGQQTLGTFTITVKGDPFKKDAWHLGNTGQKAYSEIGGTAGMDLNLADTISGKISGTPILGQGIRIAVSDSGIQDTHEDLIDRMIENGSRNYAWDDAHGKSPFDASDLNQPGNAHGTAVAGIIAATGWNDRGSRGIAPLAGLAGFRYLAADVDQTQEKEVDQADGDFDVFSYSYGLESCATFPMTAALKAQLTAMTTTGRNGKGTLYVKASGNEFVGNLEYCNVSDEAETRLETLDYLGNSALDETNSSPEVLVVGAVDARGISASYSSPGSNLWISAPAGEDGEKKPAIVTTDYMGESGFSSYFDGMGNTNYTSLMNGSSAATPMVSGAIALMLSANPALTARQVRMILAKTARVAHPTAGNSRHPFQGVIASVSLTGHVYQQGWVTNAAGIKFHNWYGFGMVNVDAAVKMARDNPPVLGAHVMKEYDSSEDDGEAAARLIPDNSAVGLESTLFVPTGDDLTIEAVQIEVIAPPVDTENQYVGYADAVDPWASDLGVELTSPSGTKSILMNINSNSIDTGLWTAVLLSNAFLDEKSKGSWKLKLIDGRNGLQGGLYQWKLRIYGH